MRLSSILCLLALVSLPSLIRAQPNQNQADQPHRADPTTGSSDSTTGAAPAKPKAAPSAAGSEPGPGTEAAPVTGDAPADAPAEPEPEVEPEPEAEPYAEPGPPQLEAPENPYATEAAEAPEPTEEPTEEPLPSATAEEPVPPELAIPSPGELGDRLAGDLPPPEEKHGWAAPSPILTLHGYLRARGELMDRFWLGRGIAMSGPDPFSRFRPIERANTTIMCAGETVGAEGDLGNVCKVKTLQFASMRFRFSPQLNISEDIRIKSTFDILDNYVLGDGPRTYYGQGEVANQVFPSTTVPTGTLILPRRVWAEVRNRDLGELRFGLMPDHWGLGMLANAGNGLDDDFSSDVGRVMGTTKVLGFYLSAAYDFLNEGQLGPGSGTMYPGYDASQLQDFDQYTFSVVRRVPDEDEEAVLARGDVVLNGGARFQISSQSSLLTEPGKLQDLNASLYTPDIWAQLRYGKLRLEVEAAWIVGSLLNRYDNRNKQYVSQLGAAFESELRLLNDKLGLYLYAGGATGDSEIEGLSSDVDYIDEPGLGGDGTADSTLINRRISTFRFHPAYRVDLILWRNIMRQITGAMYVKPGISYDFVRDSFGQLIGARVDLVYSRASAPIQTWGNDPNLGVELNAQVYWRSSDGPNMNDGYHAILQYGVLFPMQGLAYLDPAGELTNAQTLRLVLGVVF